MSSSPRRTTSTRTADVARRACRQETGVGGAEDGGVALVGEGAVEGLEAELELEAVVLAEVVAEDGEGEVAGGAEVAVIVVGCEGSLPSAKGLPDQEVAIGARGELGGELGPEGRGAGEVAGAEEAVSLGLELGGVARGGIEGGRRG